MSNSDVDDAINRATPPLSAEEEQFVRNNASNKLSAWALIREVELQRKRLDAIKQLGFALHQHAKIEHLDPDKYYSAINRILSGEAVATVASDIKQFLSAPGSGKKRSPS